MADRLVGEDKKVSNANIILGSEEERMILATAIEQSSVAILMTDIDGSIIYVNPAFEKISGYATSELIGRNPRVSKSGLTDKEEAYTII